MPRRGKRFSRIKDAFGQWWDVSEFRGTVHGFDVILGFPSWKRRGTGGVGRAQVILTPPLVRHLERFRMNPGKANLPFSPTAMRRLREELGHHIRKDIRRWWENRLKDVTDLSGFNFAAKHGKSPEAAHYTHRVLLGKKQQPKLWWKAPNVLATLASAQTDSEIATGGLAVAMLADYGDLGPCSGETVNARRNSDQKTSPSDFPVHHAITLIRPMNTSPRIVSGKFSTNWTTLTTTACACALFSSTFTYMVRPSIFSTVPNRMRPANAFGSATGPRWIISGGCSPQEVQHSARLGGSLTRGGSKVSVACHLAESDAPRSTTWTLRSGP